jgi:hypothetical protein
LEGGEGLDVVVDVGGDGGWRVGLLRLDEIGESVEEVEAAAEEQ